MNPLDKRDRAIGSLRLSVTDRCNLRCSYCMPEEHYVWLPRESILTFEELSRLTRIFVRLGAGKVRLTGGEPLLRHNVVDLVSQLKSEAAPADLSMTTNGVRLAEYAADLKAGGLDRLTLSLDTLSRDKFRSLTRRDNFESVMNGLRTASEVGFERTKINTVVVRGFNDDEIPSMVRFANETGAELRFIEYMDVGGATRWNAQEVVSRREILEVLKTEFGRPDAVSGRGSAPAERFRLPSGQVIGIIASTTEPFCRDCDRSRITADGLWLLCLYADDGFDLRSLVRGEMSDEDIANHVSDKWKARSDRGAELRKDSVSNRQPLYQIGSLKSNPHREMHTRGG